MYNSNQHPELRVAAPCSTPLGQVVAQNSHRLGLGSPSLCMSAIHALRSVKSCEEKTRHSGEDPLANPKLFNEILLLFTKISSRCVWLTGGSFRIHFEVACLNVCTMMAKLLKSGDAKAAKFPPFESPHRPVGFPSSVHGSRFQPGLTNLVQCIVIQSIGVSSKCPCKSG